MEDKINLVDEARKAGEAAYAPYSGFKVGAAIKTASGRVFRGCNVENASYGLTVCAERIALFNAVAAGEQEFSELAIHTATETPFYPCGACRQVLSEFNPELKITVVWNGGKEERNLSELLPDQFKIF